MSRFVTIRDPAHAESIVREAYQLGNQRLTKAEINKGLEELVRRNPVLKEPERVTPGTVIVVPDEPILRPRQPVPESEDRSGETGGGRSGSGSGGVGAINAGIPGPAGMLLAESDFVPLAVPVGDRVRALREAAETIEARLKEGLETAVSTLAEEKKLLAEVRKSSADDPVLRKELDRVELGIKARLDAGKSGAEERAKALAELMKRVEKLG